jgi:hypothetical protein
LQAIKHYFIYICFSLSLSLSLSQFLQIK